MEKSPRKPNLCISLKKIFSFRISMLWHPRWCNQLQGDQNEFSQILNTYCDCLVPSIPPSFLWWKNICRVLKNRANAYWSPCITEDSLWEKDVLEFNLDSTVSASGGRGLCLNGVSSSGAGTNVLNILVCNGVRISGFWYSVVVSKEMLSPAGLLSAIIFLKMTANTVLLE